VLNNLLLLVTTMESLTTNVRSQAGREEESGGSARVLEPRSRVHMLRIFASTRSSEVGAKDEYADSEFQTPPALSERPQLSRLRTSMQRDGSRAEDMVATTAACDREICQRNYDDEDAFVLVTPEELGMSRQEAPFSFDEDWLLNVSFESTSSFRPLSESDLSTDEDDDEDENDTESDPSELHTVPTRVATLFVPSRFRLQPRFNVCHVKLI
jgi:hypothetical protein